MEQFLKQSPVLRHLASREYGTCGRLVVIEHGGRPLSSAIDSAFEERAYMALQLIALVRSLWVGSLTYLLYSNDGQPNEHTVNVILYDVLCNAHRELLMCFCVFILFIRRPTLT